MLWQLVVVAAALGAAYYRWSLRRLYRLAREIPSAMKEYPIVGHTYLSLFVSSGEDKMKLLEETTRIANQRGGNISFWILNRIFICTSDPDTIEVVSRACLAKDKLTMKFMQTIFGNSMAFAPVDIWHERRKMMAPFFSVKNVNQLLTIVQSNSSTMVDSMRSELGGGSFSIFDYLTSCSFHNICETLVDIKIDSQPDPNHFVLHSINESLIMVLNRIVRPWLHPDIIYKQLPVYKQFVYNMERLYGFAKEIIWKKQNESAAIESKEKSIEGNARPSFLNTVQQNSKLGKEQTDLVIREEVVACIFGNDTSSVCLSYTTVLLSRYPGVQDKVYQELKEEFGDSDRPVTPEDLPRLKYLEAVIKESLRLYPPFPVVAREVHNDVVLPSGKTLVEGTSVLINIWGTHRNPAYWGGDAELFRPERFLESPLRHPTMFIPFSYSVRNCIGQPYAMMTMKTVLANLLRRYKLLPPANMAAADLTEPLRLEFSVFMKAVDNFLLRVEERK